MILIMRIYINIKKRMNELNIFGYEYEGYFIDIGVPDDYKKAQNDFKNFRYK